MVVQWTVSTIPTSRKISTNCTVPLFNTIFRIFITIFNVQCMTKEKLTGKLLYKPWRRPPSNNHPELTDLKPVLAINDIFAFVSILSKQALSYQFSKQILQCTPLVINKIVSAYFN